MFLVGYEFEFATSLTHDEIIPRISNILGMNHSNTSFNAWKLKWDSTIESKRGFNNKFEIVTPPIYLKDSLMMLKNILNWMINPNIETNNTTGLHINISFQNSDFNRWIDPLFLCLFVDEKEILRKYNRTNNIYCLSNNKELKPIIRNKRRYYSSSELLDEIENEFLKKCRKHRSINFNHLLNDLYLEIRMFGNKRYEYKYSCICEDISYICNLLNMSLSDSNDNLILEKIYQI